MTIINLIIFCIWLVDSVECVMMHGLTNLKFINATENVGTESVMLGSISETVA